MSESPFSNLPRFDHHPDQGSSSGLTYAPVPAAEPEARPAPATPQPEEMAPTPVPRDPNIDLLLNRLAEEIDRADARAQAQTVNWVSAISEKLFPELSKAFLAEEIARQLPELMPGAAAHIDIAAPESLAQDISELVESSPRLKPVCTVSATPSGRPVEISWTTGGLTLDFDGLLDACLARLNELKSHTRESV